MTDDFLTIMIMSIVSAFIIMLLGVLTRTWRHNGVTFAFKIMTVIVMSLVGTKPYPVGQQTLKHKRTSRFSVFLSLR